MEPIKNLLPATVPSSGQVPQEWKPQESGELEKAISDRKISSCTKEEVKEAIRYAMVKVGLRANNWPSDEEKELMYIHVATNYSGHTPSEIRLAFDLAILRKLDLQEREIPCYENFSCLYFSTIMNAYRLWAKQEYRQFPKEPAKEIEHKEDLSDKAMQDWFVEVSERVLSGSCSYSFVPLMLYDWKEKRGEIKKTSYEKMWYLAKAVEIRYDLLQGECEAKPTVDNKRLFESFSEMRSSSEFVGKEIDILKGMAKRLILYDMIKNKQDA